MTEATEITPERVIASHQLLHNLPEWGSNPLLPRLDMAAWQAVQQGILDERHEHSRQAEAQAQEMIPYTFSPASLLSDSECADAHDIIRNAAYNALEAAAEERRLLATVACFLMQRADAKNCEAAK